MLSKENNELLTRVGRGTPMGALMRNYWIPASFADKVAKPDGAPVRVRLLGENLVLFRDSSGNLGLIDEACPHRLASLFYGRNEGGGLRCVYHGIKFDTHGECVDVPCVPRSTTSEQLAQIKRTMKVRAYPCIERGGLVWTYMGEGAAPDFPALEWTLAPDAHRYTTRHIQECNWLQALEGGFDAPHLTFLHGGDHKDRTRDVVPSFYEVAQTDFGFIVATGREIVPDRVHWNLNIMLMPFHKIISTAPAAAHMWVPVDDETTMLYSIDFHPDRPLNASEIERAELGEWIHTENVPGTDHALRNRRNDYQIDRALQASGASFTGIKGFGTQDCAVQETMGAIVDRSRERLLIGDTAIVKLRRLLLAALREQQEGKRPPGLDPQAYRVRSLRCELAPDAKMSELIEDLVRIEPRQAPIA
ncbi:MAG: Rieske 2Fe-2S domain-containing protein [Beijerinckiaceae bacterium]|nr:Rieske 2Fe-2S domain-containing protein [Beijerinckiaceae bacterium]